MYFERATVDELKHHATLALQLGEIVWVVGIISASATLSGTVAGIVHWHVG